jgi:hypothetical protein
VFDSFGGGVCVPVPGAELGPDPLFRELGCDVICGNERTPGVEFDAHGVLRWPCRNPETGGTIDV